VLCRQTLRRSPHGIDLDAAFRADRSPQAGKRRRQRRLAAVFSAFSVYIDRSGSENFRRSCTYTKILAD
jgi:hypothetical protein